jgi:hypothetical protein
LIVALVALQKFDQFDVNCGSRQEEMRLAALVAAKETVVQKNADSIKVFRFVVSEQILCLIPFMGFIFATDAMAGCREAMAERDQEMRRILLEEETQLKNLVAEYKLRFERERERLLDALRECGRCTTLISEIIPVCVNSQKLASEILSGKSMADANAVDAAHVQPPDAVPNRADLRPADEPEPEDGFKDASWDLGTLRPGSTVQLKVSGPAPTWQQMEDAPPHAALEESLL